eukprot:1050391_1
MHSTFKLGNSALLVLILLATVEGARNKHYHRYIRAKFEETGDDVSDPRFNFNERNGNGTESGEYASGNVDNASDLDTLESDDHGSVTEDYGTEATEKRRHHQRSDRYASYYMASDNVIKLSQADVQSGVAIVESSARNIQKDGNALSAIESDCRLEGPKCQPHPGQ